MNNFRKDFNKLSLLKQIQKIYTAELDDDWYPAEFKTTKDPTYIEKTLNELEYHGFELDGNVVNIPAGSRGNLNRKNIDYDHKWNVKTQQITSTIIWEGGMQLTFILPGHYNFKNIVEMGLNRDTFTEPGDYGGGGMVKFIEETGSFLKIEEQFKNMITRVTTK